jgi:hypothetical protein
VSVCISQRTSSSLFRAEPRSLVNIYSLIQAASATHPTNAYDVCESDALLWCVCVHFKCRCDRDEMTTEIFCFICISFFLSHLNASKVPCEIFSLMCARNEMFFPECISSFYTAPTTFPLQTRHHTLILSNTWHNMHHLWRCKQTFLDGGGCCNSRTACSKCASLIF